MTEFRSTDMDVSWLTDRGDPDRPIRVIRLVSPATDVDEGPLALATDEHGVRAFVIGLDTTEAEGPGIVAAMVNGQVVDFGEDYAAFVAIFTELDAAHALPGEEVWVR